MPLSVGKYREIDVWWLTVRMEGLYGRHYFPSSLEARRTKARLLRDPQELRRLLQAHRAYTETCLSTLQERPRLPGEITVQDEHRLLVPGRQRPPSACANQPPNAGTDRASDENGS